uniref:Albumin domain-containing protein n=1 Tax=Calidris pygmaea TaxID=425635 RepID=A0A8C3J6U1_9CHAR
MSSRSVTLPLNGAAGLSRETSGTIPPECHLNLIFLGCGDKCAMIMFAQYVQGGTFGRAVRMAEDVTDLARRCAAATGDHPDCLKPLDSIFLDTICQEENLPRFTDCCAKKDPERNDCFLSLKNSSRGFFSPFERPNAEAACKNHSQHQHQLTGYFIYEVSRRHPFLYAPTILSVALRYEEMMKNCCGSAEDPAPNPEECFRRQAPKVVKPVKEDGLRQEHTCGILKKFGERTLKALKLAQISQKFPKADFATVNKLVTDIANMHQDCCRGDMLDCMHDREEILHYVCTNQDILSSKIKTCCEKPLLQRSECIVNADNDDKPAGLSPHVREFIEDKGICERFAQEKDAHLARFLYEYSRRHPEFSAQMLLRIGKGYEELLQECCRGGAPDDCCSRGEEELKKHIYETESVMKTSCDIYKEKGDYYFQNEYYLFFYQMTTIGSKCCQLSQDKLLPCAEENLDLVLGEICRRHLSDPINPGVCQCCSGSYALRRPCMGKLELDENYVPLTLTPGLFPFHEDLYMFKMLVTLIKYKPQITQEQLSSVTAAFAAMRERCCRGDHPETCFLREVPLLSAPTPYHPTPVPPVLGTGEAPPRVLRPVLGPLP